MIRMRFFRFFKSGCDDVEHVRLPRTLESTIFEGVALFLVIVTWFLAIWMYRHAPETIPTHFDINGNANNYGSRLVLLFLAGASTFLTIFQMVCAYIPTYVANLPTKLQNHHQYILTSRMVRVTTLLTCLLFICAIFLLCYPESPVPKYFLFIIVGAIAIVAILFVVLIRRARTA